MWCPVRSGASIARAIGRSEIQSAYPMQRYHRRRHRLVWCLLFPAVVIIIIVGISFRPEWPVIDVLPGETLEPAEADR